jgi:hypothetical protein
LSGCIFSTVYYYRTMYLESLQPGSTILFNPIDYIHDVSLFIGRQFVIAIKYGYYSSEHSKIINSSIKASRSSNLQLFDLIGTVISTSDTSLLYERLDFLLERFEVNPEDFFFMINEDEMEGFERLLSREAMVKFYSLPENDKAYELKT